MSARGTDPKEKRREKKTKEKIWAYVYMPILYILLACALAYGALQFFREDLQVLIQAFSSDVRIDTETITSIFAPPETTAPPPTEEDDPVEEIPEETVQNADVQVPYYNTEYAHLSCDRIGVDTRVIFGDSEAALHKGACQYHGSWMPGYGGTILIAGHNGSVFNGLQYVQPGDVFTLTTNYGVFEYEVSSTKVWNYKSKEAFDLTVRDHEQLVLYTCWPIYMMSGVKDRLFVYCEKISGPTVVGWEVE